MKKQLFSTIFVCLLMCTMGCGADEINNDQLTSDYMQDAIVNISDEYYKYELLSYRVYTGDEVARNFIDLNEYQSQIERDDSFVIKESALKTKEAYYRWQDHPNDGGCSFYRMKGYFSDEAYETEKADVLEYVESLDVDLRCEVVEQRGDELHHEFRQYVNGEKISNVSRTDHPTTIYVDVGRTNGFCIILWYLIGDVDILETYESKDFISIDDALSRALMYRRDLGSRLGEKTTEIEVELKKVEVAYFAKEENEDVVLIPVYELSVEENVYGRPWEAIYTIDVFTGYVYDRNGDF